MGQPGLRLIHGQQDTTVPPVLTAQDLPIGPLAGLEIPLWRSATGKAEHASATCPRLDRGMPRQPRTITTPPSGTLANLPVIPRCSSCPDPLPAYHQQATRLLGDADELANTATALRNGYNLVTYGQLLRAAEHDSLEPHGEPEDIDRLLHPALQRLRAERQRLLGQHRHTYTDQRAQRDLKTIAAAALLKVDVSRRDPATCVPSCWTSHRGSSPRSSQIPFTRSPIATCWSCPTPGLDPSATTSPTTPAWRKSTPPSSGCTRAWTGC